MQGMGNGLNAKNPTIVSAFHAQLLHQGLIIFLVLGALAVAWNVLRSLQFRRAASSGASMPAASFAHPEAPARRLLRISFGILWIFDGILQTQSSMPLGMTTGVIQPAAAASPSWVQHVDNAAATIWSYHPIAVPASAVWIQIGIGIWLLVAPRGVWSRLAGLASVGWGLVVWAFGEAFGGIFAPGLTWMFGAPGAVLFYCAAGLLLALPESSWATPRLGRVILRCMGLFFVGMAMLQAWPGRGFWQGRTEPGANPGTLTGMTQQMAQTPQPHLFSSWVNDFATLDAAHGWGVNLFVVIALVVIGTTFLVASPRLVRLGVLAGAVLCLADWIFVEDFGFFGGVGTDPNSMVPMSLVFIAGYLALTRPSVVGSDVVVSIRATTETRRSSWHERLVADPGFALRAIGALGAIVIITVGAVPMAVASASSQADPILEQAIGGTPNAVKEIAPAFNLVNQDGQAVSLASLHGKTIALTFLDDVCTSDCPIIAQEFRIADGLLGSDARNVDFVAINANPRYVTPNYLQAFDQQEYLGQLPNWLYLTGPLGRLRQVWASYGVLAQVEPAGAMIAHSEIAYVIDGHGFTREILDTDPGPATQATRSSFAVTLANSVEQTLHS